MRRAIISLLALVACSPAKPTPTDQSELRVVPGAVDAKRFLAGIATQAAGAGASTLQPIGAAVMSEGEQLGSFVEVPESQCVLALSRAGASVRDVDLFVYSDEGDQLAADEAPSSASAVMICPPHPRRVYVAARVMTGQGMLALGVMNVDPAKADAVAKAVDVRGRPGQDTGKLEAWAGLEAKIRDRRMALGSRWEDIRRVAMPLDPRAHAAVTVPADADRCLDVLITPSEEVQAIDAYVVDGKGRVVARGKPPGRDRTFVLCSALKSTLTVMVRPRVSSGLAAIVIARSPVGSASDIPTRRWVDAVTPLVDKDAAVARHAQRVAKLVVGAPTRAGDGTATVGVATPVDVSLAKGCSRIDVVGGAPLGPFDASLWRSDGRLLGRARGSEHAALFYCGEKTAAHVEVLSVERGGPFAVEIRKHEGDPPAALAENPRAASRLLARLDAMRGPIAPADAATAKLIELGAGSRVTRSVTPPRDACTDVVAASGGADAISISAHPAAGAASGAGKVTRGGNSVAERYCSTTKYDLSIAGDKPAKLLLLAKSASD